MRHIKIFAIFLFLLFSPKTSYAEGSVACQACVATGALIGAILGMVTWIYPAVGTKQLLEQSGENKKLSMAHMAFVVNAPVSFVSATSFAMAYIGDKYERSTLANWALGVGIVSGIASLGTGLTGLIQSQRAKDELAQLEQQDKLSAVLGFSYLDVAVKGFCFFGVSGVLFYQGCSRCCLGQIVSMSSSV